MSIYSLEIYRKPIEAIKKKKKKVEIRTNNSYENIDYTKLEPGDIIKFQIINGPPFVGLEVVDVEEGDAEDLSIAADAGLKSREVLHHEQPVPHRAAGLHLLNLAQCTVAYTHRLGSHLPAAAETPHPPPTPSCCTRAPTRSRTPLRRPSR